MITGKVSLDHIASQLYDLEKPGICLIKNALNSSLLPALLSQVSRGPFQPVPKRYGCTNVCEDITYFTTGSADRENKTEGRFSDLTQLHHEFSNIYDALGKKNGFANVPINSTSVYRYAQGSEGMGVHQDYAENLNLIAIFSLSGKAILYTCKDRNKSDSVAYLEEPGDCVLLRAARCPSEQPLRPLHYVENVGGERTCVVLRATDLAVQEERLKKWYGK